MPAYRDLTGQRFGRLVAIENVGRLSGRPVDYWRCVCDCGAQTTVPRYRLSGRKGALIRSCEACRLGIDCVVCGKRFIPASSKAITCSEPCRAARRRETLRAAAQARTEMAPDMLREAQARYRARLKEDPARASKVKEYKKAWYLANADRINAKKADARARMTPEERAQIREYMRAWHRKMREDPQRHAEYLASQMEARRKMRLADLIRLGAKLRSDL